jgi:hypothetical protein
MFSEENPLRIWITRDPDNTEPIDKATHLEVVPRKLYDELKGKEPVVDKWLREYCLTKINDIKTVRKDALKPPPGETSAVWDRYESNFAMGSIKAYEDVLKYIGR